MHALVDVHAQELPAVNVHALADVHAQALPAVHAQAPPDVPSTVPTHVASFPSWAATTALHVASAPALPVHVPTMVPTHVASFPPSAATTASHVASAPPLPVHVPRDSEVQAALLAGLALSEQTVLAAAEVHVLAEDVPTQVASFPPSAATTASHVASAPALPVHVPRDSEVHAAPFTGWALSEQAVFANAELHVLAADEHVLAATVPTHVVFLPPWAATTASHVASAPALPVHVPSDSDVQAALYAGLALFEQAVLADADVHVFAICTPLPAVATVGSLLEIVMIT